MIHISKISFLTEQKDSSGKAVPFNFKAITLKGEIIEGKDCVVTSSHFETSTRNVKFPNNELRKLKNFSFIEINGVEICM